MGKVLGGFFGFMFGNIFGMLLGVWLGHRFDRARSLNFNNQSGIFGQASSREKQKIFFDTTFSVMGHLAKAKGQITETDIQVASAYMDHMRLQGEARALAQQAFSDGKSADFALKDKLADFADAVGRDKNVLLMFLGIQVQVAHSDGIIDDKEITILYTITERLGLFRSDLDRLIKMVEGQRHFHQNGGQTQQQKAESITDSYDVLGIDKTATDKEVKRAYRKLMSQNHPDKLASKGLPEEMMNLAKEKAQDIQHAYETLRKERGFK
jgi:DnaJ like chaperone protein